MPRFKIGGIKLQIPENALNDNIRAALNSGAYEYKEFFALQKNLRETDRVLELGGGAGYLGVFAAQTVGPENVAIVEASPIMARTIEKNLQINECDTARVLQGAVVGQAFKDETITFEVSPGFWASSIAGEKQKNKRSKLVEVPALKFSDLQEAFDPTVVVMDIEGAELDIIEDPWRDNVRLVIMETHPDFYGIPKLSHVMRTMFDAGFHYMPWGSRGNVIVFERETT